MLLFEEKKLFKSIPILIFNSIKIFKKNNKTM